MKYIFIIGAMKSGTTSLFRFLVEHPKITGATNKECGFFAFDEHYHLGKDWYHSLFAHAPEGNEYFLDATTDYSKWPYCKDILSRMTEFCGDDFSAIYLIRHPYKRIESHARHTQINQREVGRKFSPLKDFSFDSIISPVNIQASCYATQLDQYRSLFDAGRLKVVLFEDLIANSETVISDIFSFLNLETLDFHKQEFLHSNSADYKLRYKIKTKRFKFALGKSKKKIQGRFSLNAAEKERLRPVITDELKRLEADYNVNWRPHWSFDFDI